MVKIKDYGKYETAWCPGCGNFSLLEEVKKGLAGANIAPHEVVFVSGIGQAAKAPHYLNANVFNGLHGRSLPVATGIKLSNPDLVVIAESGDGCNYGEGGNHFLAAIRRNIDITLLVHNNQVYALTKGQASPTSEEGFHTKAQPHGVYLEQFNPVLTAVAMKAGFVARSFTGLEGHLSNILQKAIKYKGLSLIDILQPCVSFNKINNFAWYKKRCYDLAGDYDPGNWDKAMKKAEEWGDKIPVGIIYKNKRPAYGKHIGFLKKGSLLTKTKRFESKIKKLLEAG